MYQERHTISGNDIYLLSADKAEVDVVFSNVCGCEWKKDNKYRTTIEFNDYFEECQKDQMKVKVGDHGLIIFTGSSTRQEN